MHTIAPRLLLFAAFLCGVAAASPADTVLRAVRDNHDVSVADPERLAAKLVSLLNSCSVNSTAYAVSGDTWVATLASNSFVHVVFAVPRQANPKSGGSDTQSPRSLQEILLPLPEGKWPEHVLVKSEGKTLSFTKYDPRVMKEIVLVQELQLRTVRPYESLLRLSGKQSLLPDPALDRTRRHVLSTSPASAQPVGWLTR